MLLEQRPTPSYCYGHHLSESAEKRNESEDAARHRYHNIDQTRCKRQRLYDGDGPGPPRAAVDHINYMKIMWEYANVNDSRVGKYRLSFEYN